ncbi:response regulator [Lichenifustis flavocetrariae]|uniref:Response regulator transcription factor n=1 Tax=Lichenifustis flavocetrariae TaxID=2949735 RepID=A0AA41Z1T8_9HYPH|nr:response regulator [Lichenifustis flavocetrariae]MCW6511293.1 response regulator transcription factor [Lichenifustis flavocetrariae]
MPQAMIVTANDADAQTLVELLVHADFTVEVIARGDEADARLARAAPDIVLVDLPLPGISGIELCHRARARKRTRTLPIIIVTALADESDRVRGLDAGADDYVVIPFSPRELTARIRSCLRRVGTFALSADILTVGNIVIDRTTMRVSRAGRQIEITTSDVGMLAHMMENAGRVVSRAQLARCLEAEDLIASGRAIDVRIGRLRRALALNGEDGPIRTVRNEGYTFDVS